MEQLIERSYKAIKDRGLITDKTMIKDFVCKIIEEDAEFMHETIQITHGIQALSPNQLSELIDSITVRIMLLRHLGYNFIEAFETIVIKNESRANDRQRNKKNS